MLRTDELLVYLKARKQPMCVAISEDATRVDNRLQYDSRTNEILGFVLPINQQNGMPIPMCYKARSMNEILQHFSKIFKCGANRNKPFYFQDYPHNGTKLRTLLLKTIEDTERLPIGRYYIQQSHLQEIINNFSKDKHLLTPTDLKPIDRQNFGSVVKICSDRVINLLKKRLRIVKVLLFS